ncbi:hypothetical protein HHK36_018364 [Tetracentron sinense]|uniref:RING-type E3 ubiquitin transferase n=1 Tax=Tetracentron sinense TaxID=13715 RepID=A0A834YVR6_TETSI|nr:hypothetical protein HHK36_018364 [Tetracentron sinense]
MHQSPRPSPELHPSRWNPLVISLVGSICTILLCLSYYKILKRHCIGFHRGNFFRNQTQRRLLNEANPDDPSLQFHSRGIDSFILHALPAFQFRKKIEDEFSQGNTDCAVCLGDFEEGEWLRLLPNCVHAFHISCIDTWFQSHSNCPLCRSHVICDFAVGHSYSVSVFTLLETLRREDAREEREAAYQVLRSEILQNSALRRGSTNANQFDSGLDASVPNVVSSVGGNGGHNLGTVQMDVQQASGAPQETTLDRSTVTTILSE